MVATLTGQPDATASEWAREGAVDLTVHPGYAIPVIDLDNETFGGLALSIGGSYAVVDGLLIGARARYDYLLLDTDSDLHAWIIDARATLGWFVWRGLQPYLALGATVVGNALADEANHDPYFGAALGISYTFGPWRTCCAAIGLEAGLEVSMMFHPDFRRTQTMAGTWNDGVFAYPLIFIGGRFSFVPGGRNDEVENAR